MLNVKIRDMNAECVRCIIDETRVARTLSIDDWRYKCGIVDYEYDALRYRFDELRLHNAVIFEGSEDEQYAEQYECLRLMWIGRLNVG